MNWIKNLWTIYQQNRLQRLGAKIVRTYTPYVSQGHFDSEVLQQVKRFDMDKGAIKELLYGGLKELTSNKEYFYHSTVGSDYCHFTPAGEHAMLEFTKQMAISIRKSELAALDKRAKELVVNGLKGETF